MVRLAAVVAVCVCGIVSPAFAQPGNGSGARHIATPPMPQVMPSPMPSLPPPTTTAPGETRSQPFPNSTVPFSIAEPGFVAHVQSDGRVRFSDGRREGGLLLDPTTGPVGRWSFDLTDILFGGPDPYLAAKLDVLDSTRAHRLRMKANHETELMDRALSDLTHYLHAVWSYKAWSPAVRRRVLFELWDEAAERGNALMVDGGVRARVIISNFITARLPPGSEDAYTAAELATLNRNRSSAVAFAPYGEVADPLADRVAIAMLRHF